MRSNKRKFKLPLVRYDPEEVLRLMKRKPSEIEHLEGCLCCGNDHFPEECPCVLDKIPAGVEISRIYVIVCIGCGRIGEICCSKGGYAILKDCYYCFRLGHWYWERDKCVEKTWNPPDWVKVHSLQEVEDIVKKKLVDKDSSRVVDHVSDDEDQDERDESDGYNSFEDYGSDGRKLKLPDTDQYKELLRLMKRERKPYEIPDGNCCICGDDSHYQHGCPCNQKIPQGVIIDNNFDQVCIGCGRIGQVCCSKGAYAVLKDCWACGNGGHWLWEGMCDEDFVRPPWLVEVLSMKEVPPTLETSLQNEKGDEVMVNDEKNGDEIMVEDDSGKKDEAKGGNASSKQISFEQMEQFWVRIPEADSKDMIDFTERIMSPHIFDDEELRDAYQFPVKTQAGTSWSKVVNAVKSGSGNRDIVRSINELRT